ncbi:MAG: hypothetical protein ACO1OB_07650, partial [Archangium sp.]
ASVSVTVRPTLRSFASATDAVEPTDAGASVTLTWSTANATRVQLIAGARGALVDTTDAALMADGGYTDVLPPPIDASRIYRYELQVEGADATTVSKVISLPVRGNPLITTLTAPQYAGIGRPFTVAWTTTGAETVSLFREGIEIHRTTSAEEAASGSVQLVAPATTVNLELVARNARAGESRDNIEVQVVGTPTLTLAATPAAVTRSTPFQLTWNGDSIRNLRVFDDEGRLVYGAVGVAQAGTVPGEFNVAHPRRFVAVADNAIGEAVSSEVTVTPTDPFTFTDSLPGSAAEGQRVTLSWSGGETIYGFPHDAVTTRTGSTGFDDISATGTRVVFAAADDEVQGITTDFRMPFWGRVVGEVITISINGYVTFGPGNRLNYSDVVLPTSKLEPDSIVAYWDDLLLQQGGVFWQVKTMGTERVLIIQWNEVGTSSAPGNTFQLQLHESGRVDVEYRTITLLNAKAGIQGPRANEGFAAPITPGSGVGITWFAPATSPLTFTPRSRSPYRGFLKSGARWSQVQATIDVVHGEDLQLNEALIQPAATVGPSGRWLEFFNARTAPIDLDGWAITRPDGGVSPLSGTVAGDGVRVFGVSTDPTLNDDAGVQAVLENFDISSQSGQFQFGAGGVALASHSWLFPTSSFSQVIDYGPFKFDGDDTTSLARPQTCVPSQTFGQQAPPQRGSPGRATSCGFGYRMEKVSPGYFDISADGTKLIANTTTATILNVDLSAAPFPFFGTPRSTVRISADGYLTFDLSSTNNVFSSAYPSSASPNSVLAVFADDMGGRETDSGVFYKRMGANEDPFAPAPHWIFQWHRWSHLTTGDDFNFQAKLFDDGSIEYHFGKMVSGGGASPYASGFSSNTWLENPAGTQALIVNASSYVPGISPFTAFRFSAR